MNENTPTQRGVPTPAVAPTPYFAQRAIPIAVQFNCNGKIVHMRPTQSMLKIEFFSYFKNQTNLFGRTTYGEIGIDDVLTTQSTERLGRRVSKLILPDTNPCDWFDNDLVSIGMLVLCFVESLPSVQPSLK